MELDSITPDNILRSAKLMRDGEMSIKVACKFFGEMTKEEFTEQVKSAREIACGMFPVDTKWEYKKGYLLAILAILSTETQMIAVMKTREELGLDKGEDN